MKLNKKGFTLIELLIAIVLMLSLSILVIVGYTKISDEKKAEADLITENQIITAAEQYFSTNYFYVANMKQSSDQIAFVSLGKLVSEDYLNVTSKTSSEEKYDECDFVYATYGSNGLNLVYISYDEIYPDENNVDDEEAEKAAREASEKLGIAYNGIDEFRQTIIDLGLTKNLSNKGTYCEPVVGSGTIVPEPDPELEPTPEVIVANGISLSVSVDADYIKEHSITKKKIEQNYWYNNKVKVIVEVESKGQTELDVIDSVTLNNSLISSSYLVSDSSNNYYKKYEFFADKEGINNISIQASNKGGKNASQSKSIYLDSEAPTISLQLYKTTSNSIPSKLPKLKDMSTSSHVPSNEWINASGSKNAYLIMESKETATEHLVSGIDINKSYCKPKKSYSDASDKKTNLSTDQKSLSIVNFFKNDINTKFECEVFDKVGNSDGKKTYIIKRDVQPPSIYITGYSGSHDNVNSVNSDNMNSVIKKLVKYTSGKWTNDSILLKVTKGDNLSGVVSSACSDPRSNTTDFSGWRRVMNSSEGSFEFECNATDEAGNKATKTTFVVKRDITPPDIKSFNVQSVKVSNGKELTNNYKSYLARLSWNIEDKYTYLGKISTNYENKAGNKEWNRSSEKVKKWDYSGTNTYFQLAKSFNGETKKVKLKACDVLGNCTPYEEVDYTITDFACTVTKSTEGCVSVADNKIEGRVTLKCNAPVQGNVKLTYTYGSKTVNAPGCNVKAVNNKYTLEDEQNMAVYNFRGCGGYYTLKYLRFDVAGKKIYESSKIWDSDSKSKDTDKKCDPPIGKYTRY